jgi:hypothetical protein
VLHTALYSFDNTIVPAVKELEGELRRSIGKKARMENMFSPFFSIPV